MDYTNYPFYPYMPDYYYDGRTFPGGFPGGGFGLPGFPPGGGFGPPGPPPGGPGGGFGPPSGGGDGPPASPPPSFTPQMQQVTTFAVDPGAIRGCLFRYTYIWLENGRSFWFYPTFVGRTSVAGWRWRRWRWTFYGTDLRRIRSFQCF